MGLDRKRRAHASSLHWRLSEAYAPINGARSQWQLSRVYALLNMGESALYHAKQSLGLCEANAIGGLDLAFAYEAVARANAICGNLDEADEYIASANAAGESVEKAEDSEYFLSELATVRQ